MHALKYSFHIPINCYKSKIKWLRYMQKYTVLRLTDNFPPCLNSLKKANSAAGLLTPYTIELMLNNDPCTRICLQWFKWYSNNARQVSQFEWLYQYQWLVPIQCATLWSGHSDTNYSYWSNIVWGNRLKIYLLVIESCNVW